MESQPEKRGLRGVYQVWISLGVVLIAIVFGIAVLTNKVFLIELILCRMIVIQR